MAGGKGTRFWPKSTAKLPKQFLALTSARTMLQETYARYRSWLPPSAIYVVTTKEYMPLVKKQLPELSNEHIILEPARRDTGPCIALTALHFIRKNCDEVLVTVPSDHYLADVDELRRSLKLAEQKAKQPKAIVTLGIVPTRPETGYGYIQAKATTDEMNANVLKVQRFIEKPSLEKAQALLRMQHIYWNSGVFIWKPSTIAWHMQQYQSKLWNTLSQTDRQIDEIYTQLPSISVDYAILEKAKPIYTIVVQFQWDDVGAWTALERIHPLSENGNLIEGDVATLDASHNIIHLTDGRKAAVIGVRDLIIISTADGFLICHKSKEQAIKKLAQQIDLTGEESS